MTYGSRDSRSGDGPSLSLWVPFLTILPCILPFALRRLKQNVSDLFARSELARFPFHLASYSRLEPLQNRGRTLGRRPRRRRTSQESPARPERNDAARPEASPPHELPYLVRP